MASYRLPAVTTVPSLPTSELATLLDHLFEPCIPLHTLCLEPLRNKTFATYDQLITSVGIQLQELAESSSASSLQWLDSILGAHPRLGQKKIDSAQSKEEQVQLALSVGSDPDKLADLNALYERTFPGLRFV